MTVGMRVSPELEAKLLALAGAQAPPPEPTPEEAAKSEKDFQAEVMRLARRHGWLAYHTHDSRKSAAGFWDTTLIRGPVLVGAELKVEPNKPTPAQLTWLEALAGVQVVQSRLWYPRDMAEIERTLRGEP